MKVVTFSKIGEPTEVLSVTEADKPVPKEGEVLVKVAAASVNPVDWKLVQGLMPGVKPGPVGLDVSGTIEAMGPGLEDSTVKVGDAIYADAYPVSGTWAEYCIVKAVGAAPKPSNLDFAEAASLPLCGLTAIQSLRNGGFEKGQTIAILGGSTGVGSLAVQIAKAMGAGHIYATGTATELISGFGADTVVNYKTKSVMEQLKGKDLDLVLDYVGGLENWQIAKAALKPKGSFVTIVGDNSGLLSTLGGVVGRTLMSYVGGTKYNFTMTNTKAPAVVKDMKQLTELVEAGKVKPVLDGRTFELTTESIHEMVKVSMSHRAKGKLILKVE